jgi:hypothetical protein
MIFVLREVVELRKLGFRIETASINPPGRPQDRLTAAEVEEARRTYGVKRHGLAGGRVIERCDLRRNVEELAGIFADSVRPQSSAL